MPTPHKHADVIKAWADGQEIQYRMEGGRNWMDLDADIGWNGSGEYRVKPSNVVRYLPVYHNGSTADLPIGIAGCSSSAEDAFARPGPGRSHVDAVLRIEINPDTLELVSATMEAP